MHKYKLLIFQSFVILLLVIYVIYGNIFSSTNLDKSDKSSSACSVNNYSTEPFLSPVIGVIPENSVLINFVPLKKNIQNYIAENTSVNASIYFEYLNTGANFSINGSDRMTPASLVKLPIAMLVMKQVESGQLSLDTPIEISPSNRSDSWGELYSTNDTELPVSVLLDALILDSDSTSKNALYDQLTDSDFTLIIDSIGVEDLFDEEGEVTVKEYSRLLRSLYTSSFLSPDNSKFLLNKMSLTPRETYIPNGIPSEVKVSHKFGADKTRDYYNDAGIIYAEDRPYILIVLLEGTSNNSLNEDEASQLITNISTMTYEYVISQ